MFAPASPRSSFSPWSGTARLVSWTLSSALILAVTPGPGAQAAQPAPPEAVPPAPSPAPAAPATEGARAAVLPLVVEGEVSEGDRATLTAQLVEGLQRGSFAVVTPDQVLAADAGAADCAKARCYTKIAQSVSATHLVRLSLKLVDRDWAVAVQLIDASDGAVVATASESCEICGIADAGSLVASASATLRTKLDALAHGPATLVLASDPQEATVTLDGEIIGETPLERPVIPGKHVIRVSKEGYISIEREVTFVEGVQESVDFSLEKVPSRLPGRAWGWASLGVGLVALGGGAALTFVHDRPYEVQCSGDNVDARGECRWLWDTKWAGTGTAIAGAALTTLGVAILLNSGPGKAKKEKEVAARGNETRVGLGPNGVWLHGRF